MPTDEPLATFDASGAPGERGQDGAPGASGSSGGGDGSPGGDASPAANGQDAGTIELRVQSSEDSETSAALSGRITRADGSKKKIDRTVDFGDRGSIVLRARGGDGGDGGGGGRGGDGGRGRSGSDATRYSSGSDGGPGGDGGDGGNASSGGQGGKGGVVTVTVSERDTHLLMLTRHQVRGGKGGAPGENGSGGEGGAGGSGGSSHSWTDSESYTDSQGRSQTRTTYHSNSGGSAGRSGRSGRSGSFDVAVGDPGAQGQFEIRVADGAQAGAYPSVYDLRLVGFEHRSDNDDGIYEPEEKVHVSKITVENTGGMPTPAHREVRLSLVTQGWVAADDTHLVLPRPLTPGERHVFEDAELTFRIGLFKPSAPTDPLCVEETIRHRASVPAVHRDFEGYQDESTAAAARFLIQFPIEASPIEALHSLAPNQAARIRWTVKNVSTKAFGAASELRRAIAVRLALHESELGAEDILFFDDADRRVSLAEGFVRAIDKLAPGEEREMHGTLAIPKGATCYRGARLRLSAELGFIREPDRTRPIQYREFSVRVGQQYEAAPDAGLLLVVNNRTTEQELAAWRVLAASIGMALNVWDLSLQGGIDLSAEGDGTPSLSSQFAGKTVVLLDNTCDGPRGEGRPSAHLAKAQIFEAAAAGARFAFIGRCPDLGAQLIPTELDEDEDEDEAPGDAGVDAEVGEAFCTLSVSARGYWPWSRPWTPELTRRARTVQQMLRERHPTERYIVVHELDRSVANKIAWIIRYNLGRLRVLRTLDPAVSTIVARKVDDDTLHTGEYVLGTKNVSTVMCALGFEDKLIRLNDLLRAGRAPLLPGAAAAEAGPSPPSRSSLCERLVEAVLLDLVNEQLGVLHRGWGGVQADALPLLMKLCRAPFDSKLGRDPASEPASHLVTLIARMRFFAGAEVRLWEWLPPFSWLRRAPRLRRVTLGLLDELVERLAGAGRADAWGDALSAELEALGKRYRQAQRDHEVVGGKRGYARVLLRTPVERHGIVTDADALAETSDRILESDAYKAVCAADAKRAKRRKRLARAADQARKDLLRAETCEQLLGSSGAARAAEVSHG